MEKLCFQKMVSSENDVDIFYTMYLFLLVFLNE